MRIFLAILSLFSSLLSLQLTAKSFDLSHYQGKVVYLDFWASWCVPCRKSFPWMNKIRQEYPESKLAIIAVNLDKDPLLADKFLSSYPATFDILYDQNGDLARKYQIPGMPSSLIFDQNGKVISVHSGFYSKKISLYEKQLEAAVNQLSKGSIDEK